MTTSSTSPQHAVFANKRTRVSNWTTWDAAQDLWSKLDDERRAGNYPHARFFEVRAKGDPVYSKLPKADLATYKKLDYVKLSRSEREHLLSVGRAEGDLDSASDAMFTALVNDERWEHLDAVTVSEYAHAAARFCFPQESKWW